VKHGLLLAPFGDLADPRLLAEVAVEAERAGFDGVFVWDHMMRGTTDRAVADPWIALAAVAARTRRVRLGPLVTPLARRRPQKVARETVTLDHLSGGRLVLGVGLGVNTGGELSRFGEEDDDRRRGDLLDEALDLLCGLWSGEPVSHHGPRYRADGVTFRPRPLQLPRIPVWVAARAGARRPVRRAARFDGICPETDLDDLARMLELIHAERGSLNGFDVVAKGRPGADPGPWRQAGATWFLTSTGEFATATEVAAVATAGPPR
jgi:alkanesulfonate monooxygenase SsuD/methylene tetrahydromethanopterin reductase-like flavin-dependent oxidoreductase (luciferase family)